MNRVTLLATLCLSACAPASQAPEIALGDLEDYADFLDELGETPEPEPFEAEPLVVTATGEVRAKPDIAVITATIRAEDENESAAVDAMGDTINAVQAALEGFAVETGFTGVRSSPQFDEACLQEMEASVQRHAEITSDYYFNQRLDRAGDTETRRRPPRPRINQPVCRAQEIRVETAMVIRVEPADAAGAVLAALGDAEVFRAELFGYDHSDYDALYQDAAARAVNLARAKADAVASGAGGTLDELIQMSVSAPDRVGRFGPQPAVIRSPTPYAGQSGSALGRHMAGQDNRRGRSPQYSVPPPPVPVQSFSYGGGFAEDSAMQTVSETFVVQEASVELVTVPAQYETVYENGRARRVVKTPASVQERAIPAVTKTETVRVGGDRSPAPMSNALAMSLSSGPQTISATATLSYSYDTPLTGKVIVEPDDK